MDESKTNYAFAATLADQLASAGVAGVCVAPGSRSAALAIAFAREPRLRTFVHVDERSAAFFGLGLARASGRPAVLLCTSGTAAAEFHAAVIEAHHGRVPLLVLTADRPPELIDVGANQAIDQRGLYGGAVRWFHDPGTPVLDARSGDRWRRLAARAVAEALGPPAGPVHLNLPFREPLVPAPGEEPGPVAGRLAPATVERPRLEPAPESIDRLGQALAGAERPVLVAGGLPQGARLRAAVAGLGIPVLAEPTSHLRTADLPYDALLRDEEWAARHRPDLVIRVGAPPTSKPLNAWLAGADARAFLIDEGGGWADPDLNATDLLHCDPLPLLAALGGRARAAGWSAAWGAAAAAARAALDRALDAAPLFEAHAVRALAAELAADAVLTVGSSMPIRDVDTFWPAAAPGLSIHANRGASGIDGLVSTGLGAGAADPARQSVLLLGDLSLYHDMNGLWAIRRHRLRTVVVVLDNGGGGIFSFLPHVAHDDVFEEVFGTPLGLDLSVVARLYGLDYTAVETASGVSVAIREALRSERPGLVAVRFTREQSVAGHRACWREVAAAVSPAALP